MKKFPLIICSFFIFSNGIIYAGNTSPSEGLIEKTLNLNYGPFIYDLSFEQLKVYNFKDKSLKATYENMRAYDVAVRTEIIQAYKYGEYDYNQMNGIIHNYKNFVYYTNALFKTFRLLEKNPKLKDDAEFQHAILRSYSKINTYYTKVRNLLLEKKSGSSVKGFGKM